MIELNSGLQLHIVADAGALGEGLGWPWDLPFIWAGLLRPEEFSAVITETMTLDPWEGNFRPWAPWRVLRPIFTRADWWRPWSYFTEYPDWVNAFGLTNSGLESWIGRIYPRLSHLSYPVIPSVHLDSEAEACRAARRLNCLTLKAVHLDVSYPNVSAKSWQETVGICSTAAERSRHPLIIKLGYDPDGDYIRIAEAVDGLEMVQALQAINTVPHGIVFPNRTSPLRRLGGGGVSGPSIRLYTDEAISSLKKAGVKTPLLASGGLYGIRDLSALMRSGADAFALGTLFFYPWRPNRLVRDWSIPIPPGPA